MNKFCHNCGKQLPVLAGMKGCPFCFTPLHSLSAQPPVVTQPARPLNTGPNRRPAQPTFQPFTAHEDDDDSYIDHIEHLNVNINKLDLDIRTYQAPQETIGSVLASPVDEEFTRQKPNTSIDQQIQEFQKEAGTLRKE